MIRSRGKQDGKKHACEKCDAKIENRCDLRKHLKRNRCFVDVAARKNIKIGQDALLACMHCSWSWNNLDSCLKHVKVCSARGESSKKSIGYSCNYCGKIYNYIKMYQHMPPGILWQKMFYSWLTLIAMALWRKYKICNCKGCTYYFFQSDAFFLGWQRLSWQ